MLAPIPALPLEGHDTQVDGARDRLVRRVRLPRPERPEPERSPLGMRLTARPLRGPGIGADESLRPASLSRVRVREAMVKVQSAFERERSAKPSVGAKAAPLRIPQVQVAWVRSTDRAQKITRQAADTFTITGLAAGTTCGSARPGAPTVPAVSLGIDGLIYTVAAHAGDTAADVLARLVARLSGLYEVELLENGPDRATARLVAPR